MWPEILDVESVPSPEGCGEWTHVQSSGGHCRDGSGSEHGVSAVLRSQVLEVQSILMDHILSRRRFAVSAGVGVISIPIWNPMAFQSIVLEIQCPALPAPIVARFSPQGRAGNPNRHKVVQFKIPRRLSLRRSSAVSSGLRCRF